MDSEELRADVQQGAAAGAGAGVDIAALEEEVLLARPDVEAARWVKAFRVLMMSPRRHQRVCGRALAA
jgi:hypothetical protein